MKEYKKSFTQSISEKLDLPIDSITRTSILELKSNKEIIIDDCISLLVYEEDELQLKLCDMILKIYGRGLILKTFTGNKMIVSGFFTKIEFEV